MIGDIAYIRKGRVLSYEMTEEGLPVYVVKDEENNTYTQVEALIFGGSPNNIQNQAYTPQELLGAIPEDYAGSFVLLLFSSALYRPFILGSSFSRLCKDVLSDKNEFDDDGQMLVSTQSILDSIVKRDGSLTSLGSEGITLDTTANEKSIKLQVTDNSHVRISQKGQETTDHVVLASKLLDKLGDLEAILATMATRINILSEVCAGIEQGKVEIAAAEVAAGVPGATPYIPLITAADPNVSGWIKGENDEYRADCVRISGKNTGG